MFVRHQERRQHLPVPGQRLLQLRFEQVDRPHVWHADVQQFAVYDASAAAAGPRDLVGYFYLDLFPRTGKYGHAKISICAANVASGLRVERNLRADERVSVPGIRWVMAIAPVAID